ncbi:MAG: transporter substrate-binding domain-containing protein [Janthinobacterium lividum]
MRVSIVTATLLGLGIGLGITGAIAPGQAKEWTTVRIGMDATFAPFESVDPQGKIVGFEVDYANALCAKMNVKCTFQNQDWDGIIPALLGNKYDAVMSSMNLTPVRAKRVLFSAVYYATPPVWVTTKDNTNNDISPAALKGKLLGTQSSTTYANYFEANYKGFEIKLYPGGDEPLADLANGRLDYVVLDRLVTEKFMEKNPACCRIISEIPRDAEIFGPGVAVAMRPDDTDLKTKFDAAIKEAAADGTFDKLQKQYFKVDISPKK